MATNDVTTTQTDYRNGLMVSAFSAGTPADGFFTPKAHWYQVDVTSGTPTLVQEGLIDPGPGVATFFPSVAMDDAGNIGITYMESSSTEFVSSYVAGPFGTPLDDHPRTVFAPGPGSMPVSFREGDYSTVVLDPTDGMTFWAANEYAGPTPAATSGTPRSGRSRIPAAQDDDWYSIDVQAGTGYSLFTQSYTPSDQGGQFINQVSVNLELYDTFGNLVAVGSDVGDGHNQAIFFNAPVTGRYFIHVFNSPGTSGEYFLSVDTASFQSGSIAGQVYNDLNGDGSNGGGSDPGLNGWEVDVYDSSGNFVASQITTGQRQL